MADIVIIGAGLTGLSTAYHLEQAGFYDYKIFEKEASPGGLCRSIMQDGFTFDYTGHLLHTSDAYVRSLIDSVCGLPLFNTIKRSSFIYSQDRYTRYPYQVNLHGLPLETIAECIEGFVNRVPARKRPASFYQWVLQTFGPGFGKFFFFPYQRKIFDYDVRKLSASWTNRFVPQTSLSELIQGALQDGKDNTIGYNAHFFYPKVGGIYAWVEKLYQAVRQPVQTHYTVREINLKEKKIVFTNGAEESFKYLVNTMPLDLFLSSLSEPSDSRLQSAVPYLLCNSVISFNIGINRPLNADTEPKHWIYYPEREYPFYRIGFPSHLAESMAPPGCSSLYGEVSHLRRTATYKSTLLSRSIKLTKSLFSISDDEILTEKIITIDRAYVIYNAWRDNNLGRLLSTLQKKGIYSRGRYGAWKYSSMQDAVLDGQACAQELLTRTGTP